MTLQSNVDVLTNEITALKDLYGQLDQLRRLPHGLIKTGKVQLDVLTKAREALLGETAQKALERAGKDESEVQIVRTNSKKRQKSPEPYVRETKAKMSLFPESPPCTDLREFILGWNKEHPSCRAAFYRARRGDTSENVIVVKVKDVMTAYLMVGSGRDSGFVVEAISVFGPRESGGGPFSSSSFEVFRNVSERVGGILGKSGGGVSGVLSVVSSYSGLFVSGCSACGRILSTEGQVPVDRIWGGEWSGKHVACR